MNWLISAFKLNTGYNRMPLKFNAILFPHSCVVNHSESKFWERAIKIDYSTINAITTGAVPAVETVAHTGMCVTIFKISYINNSIILCYDSIIVWLESIWNVHDAPKGTQHNQILSLYQSLNHLRKWMKINSD